jgi:hypothetical protein
MCINSGQLADVKHSSPQELGHMPLLLEEIYAIGARESVVQSESGQAGRDRRMENPRLRVPANSSRSTAGQTASGNRPVVGPARDGGGSLQGGKGGVRTVALPEDSFVI